MIHLKRPMLCVLDKFYLLMSNLIIICVQRFSFWMYQIIRKTWSLEKFMFVVYFSFIARNLYLVFFKSNSLCQKKHLSLQNRLNSLLHKGEISKPVVQGKLKWLKSAFTFLRIPSTNRTATFILPYPISPFPTWPFPIFAVPI